MLTTDVLDTLASLPLVDHVPPAELGWLSSRAELRRFESGAIAFENGSPLREMWIVLEGTFILLVPRGGLVSAVKGFTFMDREGVPENIDVNRGLADTVAMLENKARGKSVRMRIETAKDLPPVHGIGSQLNQVWEKLIDNAIDAAPVEGNVIVTATRRGDSVVVRVMDDGPGVSEEHRARIFDPFSRRSRLDRAPGLAWTSPAGSPT